MEKKYAALILIVLSVVIVNAGQLLLKYGLNSLGALDLSIGIVTLVFNVFSNPFVFSGIVLFVVSSFFWLLALSKAELSYAFPILSLGYVAVSVLSWMFLDEVLGILRILGLAIIVVGVWMLSKT